MKRGILTAFALITGALLGNAQNLESFTDTLETGKNNYLSIIDKKTYTEAEAKLRKSSIDLALVTTKTEGKRKMEWQNMSGKDGNIPNTLKGTATIINTISFDKEQFDKCKTNQDLKRMTGHLTNNSFSHFASVSDDLDIGIKYHCFILQLENGNRALLWLDAISNNNFKVSIKVQK